MVAANIAAPTEDIRSLATVDDTKIIPKKLIPLGLSEEEAAEV